VTGRHRDARLLSWRPLRAALAAFLGMGYAGRHRAADVPAPMPERAPVATQVVAPVVTAS
jgi:hypothetical protein